MLDVNPNAPTAIMIEAPSCAYGTWDIGPARHLDPDEDRSFEPGFMEWVFCGRCHHCGSMSSAIVAANHLQRQTGLNHLVCTCHGGRTTTALLPQHAAAELAEAVETIREHCNETCLNCLDDTCETDCKFQKYLAPIAAVPADATEPDGPELAEATDA